MDEVAGLNNSSTYDVVMGIVYGVSAFFLIVVSFIILTRKYRRKKMEAVNNLEFITSRYNVYTENSQFLFKVPFKMHIKLNLLNENDEPIEVLIDEEFEAGEHVYPFEALKYPNGLYFLDLKADNDNTLRKIKINH